MDLWHITLSSTTRHALFPSEVHRCRAVGALAGVCGEELALFCIVDDHLHLVVLCDRRRCSTIARATKLALAPIVATTMQPCHIKRVNGRSHLMELHRYLLQQPAHHDLSCHPALWTGSCFLDLIGARRLSGLRLRIEDVLPRGTIDRSLGHVGLGGWRPVLAGADEVRAAGAPALVAAASTSCGAEPGLVGRRAAAVRARRVACALGRAAGLPTSELAWALGVHRGSARKLAVGEVHPRDLAAARTYLALASAVRAAPRLEMDVPGNGRRRA